MYLPLPKLDDRHWSDLAEEGRNLIPRYAPEWTDFNIHDPGITLIELLAWITEMDVFQLDQVPASHRRKFLALLGLSPRPPQAARTVLSFSPEPNLRVELPATTEFEAEHPAIGRLRFRTRDPLTVVPAALTALWRHDTQGWHDLTLLWQNREPLPLFGNVPAVDSAFYFGFDQPLPPGQIVTLYLRFSGERSGPDERQRLHDEWRETRQACAPAFNPCQPTLDASPDPSVPVSLPHHAARTVWEVPQQVGGKVSWRPLQPESGELVDETRAGSLDGFVRLTLPVPLAKVPLTGADTPRYYVRCRLASGALDAPPSLQAVLVNAVAAEQAVPKNAQFAIARDAVVSKPEADPMPTAGTFRKFTLRFNIAGEIDQVTFLPAAAEAPEFFITRWQAATTLAEGILGLELSPVGTGLGEPQQTIVLEPAPVQAHSVAIFTLEAGAWQPWQRRPNFDASTRSDRHFVLDETSGEVTFGDGDHGWPPPQSTPIFATFRSTQAERGNLPAGCPWQVADSAHNRALLNVGPTQAGLKTISNPFPATGGAAAETLVHAEGRALAETRRVTRAVTLADVEHLALTTPGAQVARAAAKANLDARYPCLQAPGVITVILLPQVPAPQAQPSPGLRALVQSYLDRRRIVGSRIEVVGPVYTEVTVRARVQRQTGADAGRVRQAVIQALHRFFDPLSGGPGRQGWPFGRDVYRSEVLQVIDGVAGVENVISLELIAEDGEPSCGNLCLGPCGLVVSGRHEIDLD